MIKCLKQIPFQLYYFWWLFILLYLKVQLENMLKSVLKKFSGFIVQYHTGCFIIPIYTTNSCYKVGEDNYKRISMKVMITSTNPMVMREIWYKFTEFIF